MEFFTIVVFSKTIFQGQQKQLFLGSNYMFKINNKNTKTTALAFRYSYRLIPFLSLKISNVYLSRKYISITLKGVVLLYLFQLMQKTHSILNNFFQILGAKLVPHSGIIWKCFFLQRMISNAIHLNFKNFNNNSRW